MVPASGSASFFGARIRRHDVAASAVSLKAKRSKVERLRFLVCGVRWRAGRAHADPNGFTVKSQKRCRRVEEDRPRRE